MKQFIFLLFILYSLTGFSQTKDIRRFDSTALYQLGRNSELIIENATKNVAGFLYNKGNGRTEFKKGLIKINDSTYIIGSDTLRIKSNSTGGSIATLSQVLTTGDSAYNKRIKLKSTTASNNITSDSLAITGLYGEYNLFHKDGIYMDNGITSTAIHSNNTWNFLNRTTSTTFQLDFPLAYAGDFTQNFQTNKSGEVALTSDTLNLSHRIDSVVGGLGGSSSWTVTGNDIYNNNSGNIGIGTAYPQKKLVVYGDEYLQTYSTPQTDAVLWNDANNEVELLRVNTTDRKFTFNPNHAYNIGFGTYSPDSSFTVEGSSHFTGNSIIDGNFKTGKDGSILTNNNDTKTLDWNSNDSYFYLNGNTRRFKLGDHTYDWYGTSIDLDDDASQKTIRYNATGGHYFTGGNVGIGTTSPSYKLHVDGYGYFNDRVIYPNGSWIGRGTFDNGSGGSQGISMTCSVGIEFNNQAGYLSMYNGGYTTANWRSSQRYMDGVFLQDSTSNVIINPNLRQLISDDGSTVSLDWHNGNIGIGTTSPTTLFHLAAVTPTLTIESGTNGSDNIATLQFKNNGSNGLYIQDNNSIGYAIVADNKGLLFDVDYTAFQRGNVGINVTSPTAKLHIKGDGTNDPVIIENLQDDGGFFASLLSLDTDGKTIKTTNPSILVVGGVGHYLTNGYGISGSNYDGTSSVTYKIDTSKIKTRFSSTQDSSTIMTEVNNKLSSSSPTATGKATIPSIWMNKDSVSIVTGKKWFTVIDTATGKINRQALTVPYYVGFIATTPTASATMYFGQSPKSLTTTAGDSKLYFRKTGTITAANIYTTAVATAGSNESWTMYIRLNGTTDYSIASVASATKERIWNNQSMSVPIAVGDYVEIKMVNPAFSTTPTSFSGGGNLEFTAN